MKIAALASVLSSVTAFAPQSTTGRTSTAVNAGLNGWVPDENVSVDYNIVYGILYMSIISFAQLIILMFTYLPLSLLLLLPCHRPSFAGICLGITRFHCSH